MCNLINRLHNEVRDCKDHVDLSVDGRVCGPEIPCRLCNTKDHYHFHQSVQQYAGLREMNSVHSLRSYCFM